MKPYVLAVAAVLLLALGSWWRYQPADSQASHTTSSAANADSWHAPYQWSPTPCWFYVHWEPGIVCGNLHTPSSHLSPHSSQHLQSSEKGFALAVVIIRAQTPDEHAEPLLYLPGGPGVSAGLDRRGIEYWLDWLSHAGLNRDLVLMDPRGVGRSRPALTCDAHDRYSAEVLTENITLENELAGGRALLARCFSELMQAPINFSADHYGTQKSARDIVGLMGALDYPRWHLLGVSYGTRLALAVAQQPEVHKQNLLRSMILDSVYPPQQGGLMAWPRDITEGLERFFSWCEQRASCRGGLTQVAGNFQSALAHLQNNPVTVAVPLWRSGSKLEVVVNDHRFMAAVFSAVYQHHLWPEIPRAISAALSSEGEGMALLVEAFVNNSLSPRVSLPAFYAVDCRDNPAGSAAEYQQALQAYPQYAHYLKYIWEYRGCIHFPPAQTADDTTTHPLIGEIPTLLLAGALDPVTPAHWAQALAEQWPHSQLVVLPAIGHAVIGSEDCVHQHFVEFLKQPEKPWHPECLAP